MALADTANLIVRLNLEDRLSRPLDSINRRLGGLGVNTGLVATGMGQIGRGVGLAFQRSLLLGGAAAAGLSTQIVAGVESLRELEDVTLQTEAAIKSTGGVAGVTAGDVRALSEEYEELGGVIDDKVIQSAQNVLLTFTQVREDAFEPALEAALNLSTRLGTDLNGAVIQVGKALSDPIRGLTALRRVGVVFTEDQEALIRALVEENDLYGAQQVILAELEKEFGGSFAARGRTQEATVARLRDAIEGLQQSLATAFIPVIDKAARKLTRFFNDPETIRGVKDLGERIANFFNEDTLDAAGGAVKTLFDYLRGVPWGTIGDGLRIAGQGAKVVIDAFLALPKEVQGVLVTALAAHKLSGGLITSGIGNIAKGLGGLFGGLRGSNPATPVFTKEVGLPGVGGGAPGAAGRTLPPWLTTLAGAGSLAGAVTLIAGIAAPFLMFNVIPGLVNNPAAQPVGVRRRDDQGRTIVELSPQQVDMFTGLMPSFVDAVERSGGEIVSAVQNETRPVASGISTLREETRQLHNPLIGIREINRRSELGIDRVRDETRQLQRVVGTELREVQRKEQATADRIRDTRAAIQEQKLALRDGFAGANARLERIANKDTSLNLDLTIPVASYVSVNEVIRQSVVVGQIRNNIPVGPGL